MTAPTPETITLPRSGLVLTKRTETLADYVTCTAYVAEIGCVNVWLSPDFSEGTWEGCVGDEPIMPTDRDTALGIVDAALVALRSALMPADARERVRNALVDCYGEAHTGDVDAVLASLNGGSDV